MGTLLGQRSLEDEWMDQPETSPADFRRALADIAWVNRHLGGFRVLRQAIERLLPPAAEANRIRILDLGCGGADLPLMLVAWGQTVNRRFEVTAVDIHPEAVAFAREATRHVPQIRIVQVDALDFQAEAGSFDLVISSMFLHHLSLEQGVSLIRQMHGLSRLGWVVNDLARGWIPYLAIAGLGALLGKGRVFRHDAPLSVRRGFRREELSAMIAAAGLQGCARIEAHWPYRFCIIGRHPVEAGHVVV